MNIRIVSKMVNSAKQGVLATVMLFFVSIFFSIPMLANDTLEEPLMPKGYATEAQLKMALLTGQVKLIDAKNIPVPDSVREIKGLEYGKVGQRPLHLDLYLPKTDKPVPGLIFIHGGAWKSGNRADMKFYAIKYAARGYATATISYRLTNEAPFPAAVHDTKCAVRWMRANAKKYNINPDKIGVSGNSAGGHLSMMAGYSSDVAKLEGVGGHPGISSSVQVVVNFYGPADLTTSFARKQEVLHDFLSGKQYDDDPELYAFASPITHLTRDDPPTLILHGTIDSTVPIAQADKLAKKLEQLNIPMVYEKFPGWPHTMDLAEPVNDRCCYLMDRFLEKYLPLPK
ncbi:MAG: alpha/beta hydrolase [Sedimentisphaerales bacterium]